MSASVAFGATDTWSGAEPLGGSPTGDWTQAGNWSGGPLPSDGDSLAFPGLAGCDPASLACYTTDAENDALTVANLFIADDRPYLLSGSNSELTLAPSTGDGLDATPATGTGGGAAQITIPLNLGTSQSWSVAGDGDGSGSVSVGALNGAGNALAVTLGHGGQLYLDGITHTGTLTVTGADPTAAPTANGELGLFGDVNTAAGDGAIAVTDIGLQLGHFLTQLGQIGSLTVRDGALALGTSGSGYPGSTQVEGTFGIDSDSATTVTLENTGSTAGEDYGQLTATGDVSLGGTLSLRADASSGCPTETPGTVDTFIATSGGAVSGQFSNLPDGAITSITFQCGDGSAERFPVEIDYRSSAVTGTFLAPTATTTAVSSPGAGSGSLGSSSGGAGSGGAGSGGAGSGGAGSAGSSSHDSAAASQSPAACATRIVDARVLTSDGVHARVSCAAGGGRWMATLRLTTVVTLEVHGRVVHRTVLLGGKRTWLAAGEQRVSAVTLNATGRRLLAHDRVLRAELVLQRTVKGHVRTLSFRRVTLRAAQRRQSNTRRAAA